MPWVDILSAYKDSIRAGVLYFRELKEGLAGKKFLREKVSLLGCTKRNTFTTKGSGLPKR